MNEIYLCDEDAVLGSDHPPCPHPDVEDYMGHPTCLTCLRRVRKTDDD